MAEADWIACEDRLPELRLGSSWGDLVLVYVAPFGKIPGAVVVARLTEIVGEKSWEFPDEDSIGLDGVSHWMPLPAPPAAPGRSA